MTCFSQVVSTLLCLGSHLDFSFERHLEERWPRWVAQLEKGELTMNNLKNIDRSYLTSVCWVPVRFPLNALHLVSFIGDLDLGHRYYLLVFLVDRLGRHTWFFSHVNFFLYMGPPPSSLWVPTQIFNL